ELGAHLAEQPDAALACAVSLLRALVYLHGRGRVHGDLKPANVLVDRAGVRLIDLGLVVPVGAQPLGGTGFFLPPEYERGASASVAGDLFAFGRTFEDAGGQHIVARWPSALRDVVAACVREAPEQRPASAEALLARLGATPGPVDRLGELTRVATDRALEVAAAALDRMQGEVVVVVAPEGSGRTRLARDLVRRVLARRDAVADVSIGAGLGAAGLDALAASIAADATGRAGGLVAAAEEHVAVVLDVRGDAEQAVSGDVLDALADATGRVRAVADGALVLIGCDAGAAATLREAGALVVEIQPLAYDQVAGVLREAGARADDRVVEAIASASEGRAGRVGRAALALAESPELGLDVLVAIARGDAVGAGGATGEPTSASTTGALDRARAALAAREHDRAIAELAAAWPDLARRPTRSVEASCLLARAYAASGRVADAETIAAALANEAPVALRLDRARWLERLGRYGDARRAARELAGDEDPSVRAAAAVVGAQAALALGDPAAAERKASAALEDVGPTDPARVRLLAIRSDIALLRSDFGAALEHAVAAANVARELGDHRAIAQAVSRLASVHALGGDPVRARDRHAEALAEAELAEDVAGLATYVMNLATAEHALGEIATAIARYEEAARLARRHGRDAVRAAALSNLGGLLAWAGAEEEAEAVLVEADEAATRCGAAVFAAQVALVRAEIAARRDPKAARAWCETARAAFVAAGAARQALETDLLDAEIATRAGDASGALGTVARLRPELERAGLGARASVVEAQAALDGDDTERARRAAELASRRARDEGDRELEARALDVVARVHERMRTGAAGAYRERARVALGDAAARLPSGLRERFLAVPERAAIAREAERSAASSSTGGARGLDDRARRLLALVRRLLLEGDERKVLESAVDEGVALTRAERAFLLTRRSGGTSEVAVARNLDRETIRKGRFRFSRSVAERVLDSGEPFLAARATEDPLLRGSQSVLDLGLRSILCVPVRGPTGLAGALYLDHRFEAGRFDETDLELVQALADIVGVALENARLHQGAARHAEELERAHAMAVRESAERAAEVERLVEA
ncbi:MAG: GAF domain-containing protein, partial [Deltaproteobacteria bacterium]|nr:GAF domain-containing protein [Deltaproteobacteria bacterium]